MKSFKEKRVVTVFGYEIQLTCSATKKGSEEKEEDHEERDRGDMTINNKNLNLIMKYLLEVDQLEMRELLPSNSEPDNLEEVVTKSD